MKPRRRRWLWALLLLLGVVAATVTGWPWRGPQIAEGSWLIVRLTGELPDRHLDGGIGADGPSFLELRRLLTLARSDARITGVLMAAGERGLPTRRVGELVQLLQELQAAGKPVHFHAMRLDLPTWIVASHARHLALHPAGAVDLRTPPLTVPFFGKALELAGLPADLVEIGEEAWTVEQFTEEEPDDGLRDRLTALHAERWKILRGLASTARKQASAVVRLGLAGPISAQRAIEEHWVDDLADPRAFTRLAGDALVEVAEYAGVSAGDAGLDTRQTIAVVSLEGLAMNGDSHRLPFVGRVQGVAELDRALAELRADPSVRGVILVIDSPGGEVLAVDEIWRRIDLLQIDHPVVALLGSQATSGGYYAALACRRIYARPETITGCVAIQGGKLVARQLLERIGVHLVTVGSGDHTAPSRWDLYEAPERAILEEELREGLDQFLERIRIGRRLDRLGALDRAAGGRLYLGEEARTRDLLDGTGGWSEAWAAICELADLDEPQRIALEIFPRPVPWWRRVLAGELPEVPNPDPEVLLRLADERRWYLGPILDW